jgi:hypothetical protein
MNDDKGHKFLYDRLNRIKLVLTLPSKRNLNSYNELFQISKLKKKSNGQPTSIILSSRKSTFSNCLT